MSSLRQDINLSLAYLLVDLQVLFGLVCELYYAFDFVVYW